MSKYIATTVEYRLVEDDWEQGELKTLSIWTEDNNKQYDSIEELLKNINYLKCDYFEDPDMHATFENDPCGGQKYHEYNRFDADLLVDIDFDNNEQIVKPTTEIYEQWKKGKHMLYSLHVCVYVKKIEDLDETDVKGWK